RIALVHLGIRSEGVSSSGRLIVLATNVRHAQAAQRRLDLPEVLARGSRGSTDSGFPISTLPSVAPAAPTTPTLREPTTTPSTLNATRNWPGPCGVKGTSNTPSSTSSMGRGRAGPVPCITEAVTVAPDTGSPDALS